MCAVLVHAKEIPKYLLHKLLDIFVSHCSLKQHRFLEDADDIMSSAHAAIAAIYIQKGEKRAELEIC